MRPSCRQLFVVIVAWSSTTWIAAQEAPRAKRIAAVVTEYRTNSHAEMIVGRLLQTHTLDGQGPRSPLQLVSLYTDQVPKRDLSRSLAQSQGFRIADSVADALTLGTGKLAVDGVLLVAEHGDYPRSPTGQTIYPKRRLFEQIANVFADSGRVVPVFSDKHLADNWQDAKWIYDKAQSLRIPLMAGSSLPTCWRYPAINLEKESTLEEVVAISYGPLDAYGYHALEMLEAIVERRRGGETGVKQVQCLVGEDVWTAAENGGYDPELLTAALAVQERRRRPEKSLQETVKQPVLFRIDYADGLRASVLTLNGAVGEWSIAWRHASGRREATLFYVQDGRPYMHFSVLLQGIETMMLTGQPAWPVERTLLTSGLLDALLTSQLSGGKPLATPHLTFSYEQPWTWRQPVPEPSERTKTAAKAN